jgi:CheY-like chemotaxis protein
MNDSPVFVVDDDPEELEIMKDIWPELGYKHPLELFSDPDALLQRLQEKDNPFLIICDVNLHKTDAFALRQKLTDQVFLSYKTIPFVFWSTSASNDQIKKGYDTGGHGFFMKGSNYSEIKESLRVIMEYWEASKAPVVPQSLASAHANLQHRK